jgi:hypothetical protein
MNKFTWALLRRIFEGQFKLTAGEAATILTKEIYKNKWKHNMDGKIGMMWRDEVIVATFTHVIEEEELFAKEVGRKNALRKLYKDGVKWKIFKDFAGLIYSKNRGYKNFCNDYAKWKRLKFFKNVWIKGKITENKFLKKQLRNVSKANKVLKGENKVVADAFIRREKLIKSGEFEETSLGLRKIPK